MKDKIVASVKKKISDNKPVAITAAAGIAASGLAALAVYRHMNSKTLLELVPSDIAQLVAGNIGHFEVEGLNLILLVDPRK